MGKAKRQKYRAHDKANIETMGHEYGESKRCSGNAPHRDIHVHSTLWTSGFSSKGLVFDRSRTHDRFSL